jgi:hypothetical protein
LTVNYLLVLNGLVSSEPSRYKYCKLCHQIRNKLEQQQWVDLLDPVCHLISPCLPIRVPTLYFISRLFLHFRPQFQNVQVPTLQGTPACTAAQALYWEHIPSQVLLHMYRGDSHFYFWREGENNILFRERCRSRCNTFCILFNSNIFFYMNLTNFNPWSILTK